MVIVREFVDDVRLDDLFRALKLLLMTPGGQENGIKESLQSPHCAIETTPAFAENVDRFSRRRQVR